MLSKFNAIDDSNGPGFLLRILWWSQSGNRPENDLAKFGYILDMKVGKKTESFYVLGYTFCNLFGPFYFFTFRILYRSKSYFPGRNLAKIHQQKKQCSNLILNLSWWSVASQNLVVELLWPLTFTSWANLCEVVLVIGEVRATGSHMCK